MENLQPGGGSGSGSSGAAVECPDSTFQLNIITLDSRNFSFHVDKNILVKDFKEKIASEVSVPSGRQHLLFRGKALKDEHLLSEYKVEHGDTLHLVERQAQPPPGPNTREPTSVNNTGHDSHAGGSDNLIGQTGHGVVLGSDMRGLFQVMLTAALLNAMSIGNTQPGVQTPHGNEREGSLQLHGQSASNPMQIPVRTATTINTGESPQELGSSSLDVLLARVSQQTGAGPLDMLRHILLQVAQSPDSRNRLNQMDNRDLVAVASETVRDMPSTSQPNPPTENRDMNQVDLGDAVRRIGILSPEEILLNLVHAVVMPSTIADANLANAIGSQSQYALGFMEMFLSELSRRLREERGRL